jgi:iron(II)-dependent oxidoreductase
MLVTEGMVLQFINNGGYLNDDFWSINGKTWRDKNKITMPMYWFYEDEIYVREFDLTRKIKPNYPVCHVSWYEAEAICKWLGGRLPTESEWEYMATNGGITKFPWGNEWEDNVGNLNYSGGLCNVDEHKEGANDQGVIQLIGNVWEWCQESIYPYDGYKIDPVYREFSYPFFGFKKVLRGGSWAVQDILINPKYRNAQMPDIRMQFTGIRIVR